MHTISKQKGFTLIELIMVIVLLGIIAIVSSRVLIQGLNAFITGQNVVEANWQGQLALERMTRDIRALRSPSDISTATASQLVFTDTTGTTITYALSGTTLTRNGQALANGIAGFTLSYFDRNGGGSPATANIRYITIDLNITEDNANYSVTTSVYPRNLL